MQTDVVVTRFTPALGQATFVAVNPTEPALRGEYSVRVMRPPCDSPARNLTMALIVDVPSRWP